MREFLKGVWEFCRFVFVPQWGRKKRDENAVDNKNAGQSD